MPVALLPLPEIASAPVTDWLAGLADGVRDPLAVAAGTLLPLFATAPYLFELAQRHADWLAGALTTGPDAALGAELARLAEAGRTLGEEPPLAAALRVGKGRIALLAAVAEVGGAWSTAQSTAALSDLADAALEACLDFLLRRAAAKGDLLTPVAAAHSGLALFALGKHGGRELNYSSDIDIVAFFDPFVGVLKEPEEATKFYTGIVRRLVALMQERIGGGYVFRTDLRLRPDPGSTPVAISVDAAIAYYESRGQNWERAAWIKARPAAGDIAVGEAFLKQLSPYVWRKHLDFATIADIQAMKRQINVAKNVGEARVAGHNVKLGRGGIREIEFFTQTQQLIAGGREPALRVRPTTQALAALAAAGWITPAAAGDLTTTYWFLRAVENRLQMLRDEQTHIMPETPEGIAAIGLLTGDADTPAFEAKYLAALRRVGGYYANLFSEQDSLATAEGSLVFTGSDDDPATLETLSRLGFADPAKVSGTVRKWHYGGYAATRAAAARAHLTELLPALLKTVAEAGGSPDDTLARLDGFLSRLPAGVQLFALLRSHQQLLELLVELLAAAPRLAEAVIHRAHVMDGLIDPGLAAGLRREDVLLQKIEAFFSDARDYQEVIDRARIVGQEQKFQIATGLLSGGITAARAGEQFTLLAETLLGRLFKAARQEFEKRHGVVPGASVSLLAFGKMASREMTFTSDLDFIMLYDAEVTAMSDGERPLAAGHYYARLTQRLLAAVSAPTAEGVLYEADLRLRPSGNAGPLATSLAGFIDYHRNAAWTWEHLALSRARVIVGDGMGEAVDRAIAGQMAAARDRSKTVADVVSMRALMARERKPRHPFDLKLATGGLVDLEFIAQSGQLLAGDLLAVPQASTALVLARLGETGLVPEGERLVEIHATYSTVLQVMSAALLHPFREEEWTPPFRELLARLTGYPSFDLLSADLAAMQAEVVAAAAGWYERAATL